jgi:hypothetical protein
MLLSCVEAGVAVAAAERDARLGDRPSEGPGVVIGCGVQAVAELAGEGMNQAGWARAACGSRAG